MKYLEGLYVYQWRDMYENNCNSFYIGKGVNALIDPGLSVHLPELFRRMSGDDIAAADVAYVINTHAHPDHFQGSEYFHKRGAHIALHKEEITFLEGAGASLYSLFGIPSPNAIVDTVLQEGEMVIGEEIFQIIATPGHSPGGIALYWAAQKALFCGDTVFEQSVGRTDFPGGNSQLLKESIRHLANLDVEHLLPGHMGIVTGKKAVQRNFEMIIEAVFPYL